MDKKAPRNPSEHHPEEIDAYLAEQPDDIRMELERVRAIIRRNAPEATERVSYGVPIFRLKRDLTGFAAMRRFCSLYLMGTDYPAELTEEFRKYDLTGRTIHFSPENPLPEDLIERIIRIRAADSRR